GKPASSSFAGTERAHFGKPPAGFDARAASPPAGREAARPGSLESEGHLRNTIRRVCTNEPASSLYRYIPLARFPASKVTVYSPAAWCDWTSVATVRPITS